MSTVRHAMDRLVNEAFSPSQFGTIWPAGSGERERSLLPIDAYATDNEVVILAAVAGLSADDLDITIEKNTLTISGTVPSVAKSDHAKGATWYIHELPSGSFRRSLTLPMDIDSTKAEATFENGVLRLVVPKAEAARARQIRVQSVTSGSESQAIAETSEDQTTDGENS
jgi:HSP20 family molecular chaperone IbpA